MVMGVVDNNGDYRAIVILVAMPAVAMVVAMVVVAMTVVIMKVAVTEAMVLVVVLVNNDSDWALSPFSWAICKKNKANRSGWVG